jgi:hypothetical protein
MNAVFAQNTAAWSATHAITADDKTAMAALRAMVEPLKGKLQGTAGRPPFDAIMEHVPLPKEVSFETDTVGGISGWWCRPRQAKAENVILHLHGAGSTGARQRLIEISSVPSPCAPARLPLFRTTGSPRNMYSRRP